VAPPEVRPVDQPLFVTASQPTNDQQEQNDPPPAVTSEQPAPLNPATVDQVLSTGLEEELSVAPLFDNGLTDDSETGEAGLGFVTAAEASSAALTSDGTTSLEHAADGTSASGSAAASPLSGPAVRTDAESLFEAALAQPVPVTPGLPPTALPEDHVANSRTVADAGGASALMDVARASLSSADVAQEALAGSHPADQSATATAALAALPLRFEGNVGQFDASVDYVVRGAGYQAGLHATGTTFVLTPAMPDDSEGATGNAAVIDVNFVGANAHAARVGEDQLAGTTNYLVGNDPAGHFTNVASYGQVSYHDVYNGIDVRYHSSPDRQLEYDFVVAPGVDASQIALRFDGANGADLDASGNLVVHSAAGDLVQHAPVAYQQDAAGVRHEVASHFVVAADGQVGFALGSYDTSRTLVIDPTWGYSTYLGGSLDDRVSGIAVDDSGNAYVVGTAQSNTFLNVPDNDPKFHKLSGAGLPPNGVDVFVAKLGADGKSLIYLTFIGGSDIDTGGGIVVNDGCAFITGETGSSDFFKTNAWQTKLGGARDAFVTRLNQAGDGATFSTYLGGAGGDYGAAITLDNNQKVYVTGSTQNSPTFDPKGNNRAPTMIPPAGAGGFDVFVCKLSFAPVTGQVSVDELYFIGGSGDDQGWSVVVDNAAAPNIYVAGETKAAGAQAFPTTQGAFRRTAVGEQDGFVLKLNPNNAVPLVYSTLFGGTGIDRARDIALDPNDNGVYVVGGTTTTSAAGFRDENGVPLMPVVLGATAPADPSNAWVAHFDLNGNPNPQQGKYFVYIGGKDADGGGHIALVNGGMGNIRLYVAGRTSSGKPADGFPSTSTLQPYRGGGDAFLAYLDPSLNGAASLLFSSFVGGPGSDAASGVATDSAGNAYLAGTTSSPGKSFRPAARLAPPRLVVDGFQQLYGGGSFDGFAVKISPNPLPNRRAMLTPPPVPPMIMAGMPVTFPVTATDPDGEPVLFGMDNAPDGATIDQNSGVFNWVPSAGQAPAAYTFTVNAADPDGRFDELPITLVVMPSGPPNSDLAGDTLSAALPVNAPAGVKAEVSGNMGDGSFLTRDVDLFRVSLTAEQTLVADVDAFQLDGGGQLSTLNSYLRVFDSTGQEVASNDDGTDPDTGLSGPDSALMYQAATDGIYYVGVSGSPNSSYNPLVAGSGVAGSTGAYHLQVRIDPPLVPPDPS
jgi:hypothetical protein